MKQKINFLAVCVYLFIQGCAPVLSQAMIDRSVALKFKDVQIAPERHVGKMMILGGTIVKVLVTAKGLEWEVLQKSLGYGMEPLSDDVSAGRFLVRTDTPLDASLFKKGQKIVFAAEVVGQETRPLDHTRYPYLVLQMREFHFWPQETRLNFPSLNFSFGVNSDF